MLQRCLARCRRCDRRAPVFGNLHPEVRKAIMVNVPSGTVHFKAASHGLHLSSSARLPLNRGLYDDLDLDPFEGNAKHQWIDEKQLWCHLCEEPVGGSIGVHLGDRDHVCLGLFVLLHSQYPRSWHPQDILMSSLDRHIALYQNACGSSLSQDHLHTESDAVRRAELQSIIWHLTHGPHQCLVNTLQGTTPSALWVSGERIFKINLSRLAAMFLPPMAPGVHSTFTQKCWGRSNQERMYEALNIATINRFFGVEPKTGRESRAFFMRCLIWELHTCLDNRRITSVAELLCEEALRRLSFELMFLQSMYYMNRVQSVVNKLGGCPSLAELHAMNSL